MLIDHDAIMSGRRKDPLAIGLRGGLWLASFPYRWAVTLRNRRFERDPNAVCDAGVPVISVGNLTTGGTGKTPIVCMVAKWYRQRGIRVSIVSRGYGRGDQDFNDEAMELESRLPDVPHVQNVDRVSAARVAAEELDAQIVLMDDGFQHRRLHRDLDIVVIDATCPFGHGHLLPRGLLREPLCSLRRAGLVMISRCSLAEPRQLAEIESTIRRYHSSVPIVHCDHAASQLLEFPDRTYPVETLRGKKVAVVSAIGNPAAFEKTVDACGGIIVDSKRLADHDSYSPETVDGLRQWLGSLGDRVERVVCTHKDLVKLQTDRLEGVPVSALLIELQVSSGQSELDHALEQIQRKIDGED